MILVEPVGFGFFVINFDRPAVSPNVGNLFGLPHFAIGYEKRRRIRQVFFFVIDDESKSPKRFDAMGITVAIVSFFFAFVFDGDGFEQLLFIFYSCLLMSLYQMCIKFTQAYRSFIDNNFIVSFECAHIGHTQFFIQKITEVGLGIPRVKGDWQFALGVIDKKLFD